MTTAEEPRSSVTLRYDQVLPEVCIRCGEPASTHVDYVFHEPATAKDEARANFGNVLLSVAALAAAVMGGGAHHAAHVDAKGTRRLMKLPFCAAHWSMRATIELRQMIAVIAVLVAVLIPVLAIIVPVLVMLAPDPNNPPQPREVRPLIIGGLAVVWVASVAAAVYFWKRRNTDTDWIIARDVGPERLTLDGVSRRFAVEAEEKE